MLKITAIELENFQSIGEKSLITIGQLTMLFGPNGAGKSTVFDALELLELICSNDWGISNKKLTDYLDRWSRNNNLNESTNQLGIGIHLEFPDEWSNSKTNHANFDRLHDFSKIDNTNFDFEVEMLNFEDDEVVRKRGKSLHFYIKFGKGVDRDAMNTDWIIQNLTIDFASRKLLEVSSRDEGNSVVRIYKNEFISFDNIESVASKDKVSSQDAISVGKESIYCIVENYRIMDALVGESGIFFPGLFSRTGEKSIEADNIQAAFEQTLSFFFLIIHYQLCNNLSLPLVKASRVIPSMDETISIIGRNTHKRPFEGHFGDVYLDNKPLEKRLANELNRQEQHWIYLCKIVADASALGGASPEGAWSNLSELGKLNSLFSDELFLENGYRLVGDVSCLVGINDFQVEKIKSPDSYAKLVRLYLKDAHQRALEIEDVGSGIGYVLPALAALVSDGRALIQQPELHLHPAMQSALGEAIVKAVENKRFHFSSFTILETHSEHLLLRIMRLLKTSKDRGAIEEALCPLTYENVSILYFDPKPDGSTQVKRLRLAPDGSFVDRWPRGFFTERYDDLFYD